MAEHGDGWGTMSREWATLVIAKLEALEERHDRLEQTSTAMRLEIGRLNVLVELWPKLERRVEAVEKRVGEVERDVSRAKAIAAAIGAGAGMAAAFLKQIGSAWWIR